MPATEIESAKAAGYHITAKRIMVIETVHDANVADGFNQKFPLVMSACGIQPMTLSLPDPGTMSDDDKQKIRARVVEARNRDNITDLLEVRFRSVQTQQTLGVAINIIRYKFDVQLKNAQNQPVWHAAIDVLPENIERNDATVTEKNLLAGNALADSVFTQMVKDGVLVNCMLASQP